MYRLVDCDTWDDPWFESLEPSGKLFFLYLLTNPRSTSCGAFELTPRKMAFETGIAQDEIERWLRDWAPRVLWWPEYSIVWLRNFYRRQGNQNEKTRINAARIVAGLPIPVQQAIANVYPALLPPRDRVSVPDAYPCHQTINEQDTDTEQQQHHAPARARARDDAAAADLPSVTTKLVHNGRAGDCAFAAAVGDEQFLTIASNFTDINVQLDAAWLRRTVGRYEAAGLSLPPPAMKRALKAAFLKTQDALGREGNRIGNPPGWAGKQIETALRDEATRTAEEKA